MSRLSSYLRQRLPARIRTMRSGIAGIVDSLRIARPPRGPKKVTLEAESFDDYCLRLRPVQVASDEALLADPLHAARIWSLAKSAPVPDRSYVIAIDGVKQPPVDVPLPDLETKQGYLRVRSGVVYPRPGIVMTEPGKALRNNLESWVPDHRLMPGFVDFADGKLVSDENEHCPRRSMDRTVLTLCHAFGHNYAHWLCDCLPYLLPWRRSLQQGRLAVLVSPLVGYQRRTLELLGVPASALVEASEPSVLCDDLVIPGLHAAPTMPRGIRNVPQPPPSVVHTIHALAAGIDPKAITNQPERIYVSRRGAVSFRHLRNEDEVETAMMRLGFAIVRPQELTFDEQVATFSRARVIAGPHGAGLTNAAFAPAGCLVVDLMPDSWAPQWMARVTLMFEHHYLPLACPSDPDQSEPVILNNATIGQTHIYTAQIPPLISALTIAMQRLGIEHAGNKGETASPSQASELGSCH